MSHTCCTLVSGCSAGACSTIVTLPLMHSAQPTQPNMLSFSFSMMSASTALRVIVRVWKGWVDIQAVHAANKLQSQLKSSADCPHAAAGQATTCNTIARTHLMMMLSAPSGVTRIAGANAYAAKFAISPTIIVSRPAHQIGSRR